MLDIKAVIAELSGAFGPSGYERAVGAIAAKHLKEYCDEVTTDRLGNVHGVRRSATQNAPKVLLSAHIDEIGFMVTKVEDGFLRFRNIGGIDPRVLPARAVTVLANPPLHGVITSIPPHLQTEEERKKPMEQDELLIDIGYSQEEAEKRVRVGTFAVYSERVLPLGDKLISGKTMDDRSCFVMLLRVLELLKDKPIQAELIIQASTQEEVGTRGAQVGAYSQAPDYAIAVDVCHAETPDAPKDRVVKMAGGVPIAMGPNANRKLVARLVELAKECGTGYQPEVIAGMSGTDARSMQIAGNGMATTVVSLPLRYMHTAVEVVSLDDIEAGAKLLSEFVLSFGKEGA